MGIFLIAKCFCAIIANFIIDAKINGKNLRGDTYHRESGKLHNANGPAVIHSNGYKEWWFNGKLHRENGPAIENPNGFNEWWVDGIRVAKEKETILNKWWNNKNEI